MGIPTTWNIFNKKKHFTYLQQTDPTNDLDLQKIALLDLPFNSLYNEWFSTNISRWEAVWSLKKLFAFVVFATFQSSRDGGVGLIFLIISIVITITIILTIFIKIRIIIQFSRAGDVGRRSVFFSSEKLASSDPRLQSAQNGSVISVPVFVNTTRIFF